MLRHWEHRSRGTVRPRRYYLLRLNRPRQEDGVVADGETGGEATDVGQEAGNQLAEEGCLCRGGIGLDPEEASQTANLLRVCQQLLASVFCPSFASPTVILGANIVHEVLVVQDKVLNRVG